jgi:hypothetical protein
MSPNELHENDIGTEIVLTLSDSGTVVDLAAATLLEIHVRKPDGTIVEWDAELYTDGTDGKLVHYTEEDDLDAAGVWKLQGYIEMAGGKWHTEAVTVRVLPVLCAVEPAV